MSLFTLRDPADKIVALALSLMAAVGIVTVICVTTYFLMELAMLRYMVRAGVDPVAARCVIEADKVSECFEIAKRNAK